MLYCTDCNKLIDDEDLDYETETYEYWGCAIFRKVSCLPVL